jgi:GNAT superfamily N-acetyltransferase
MSQEPHVICTLEGITYRTATVADHAISLELMAELMQDLDPNDNAEETRKLLDPDFKIALMADNIQVFIAEDQGHPIGLGRADILTEDPIFRLRPDNRCGYVDQMYVRSAYRSKNIGAQLLKLCEDWFRDQGIKQCVLHAAPKAIRFYARHAYLPNREMYKDLIPPDPK